MKTHRCTRTCIFFLIGLNVISTEDVKFSLSGDVIPEKGSDIYIECTFPPNDNLRMINVSKGYVTIALCYIGFHVCDSIFDISARYNITNNKPLSVIVNIRNLQTSDAGDWYCDNTLYTLIVYTTPTGLVLNGTSEPVDLSVGGVDLICETSNCTYPAPETIRWFYKEGDTWQFYTNSTPSASQGSCSGDEKIYSSTLSLVTNTVWPLQPENTVMTVKFQCRLPFPTLKSPLTSDESGDIKFAVQVTSVYLDVDDISSIYSGTITVINGINTTFSCLTSTSRPAATIVWYIGLTVKQKKQSSEFIYNAIHADNDQQIYCKAFNLQKEENAVSSNRFTLRVSEMHSSKAIQKVSSTGKTDRYNQTSDNSTLIVGIVLGLVIIVLGLYAVIVTIKIKRLSNSAEEAVQSPNTSRTQPIYRNVIYRNDGPGQHSSENEQYYSNAATGGYDNSTQEYTDLVRSEQDEQKNYDVINLATN